jgi:hypothetical protein
MDVRRCAQNLWISLLKTILAPITTLGRIRSFLATLIFFAQSKPLNFNDLQEPAGKQNAALQRCAVCQENVHKSSPLLHPNHPSRRRSDGLYADDRTAERPWLRRRETPARKPLSQAVLRVRDHAAFMPLA